MIDDVVVHCDGTSLSCVFCVEALEIGSEPTSKF